MSESNPFLPEIDLQIETCVVTAQNRKLKSTWTYEAQQDLRAWTTQEAVDQLTASLAKQIQEEIDREILEDLERPWGFRKKKKQVRSIEEPWEVTNQGG